MKVKTKVQKWGNGLAIRISGVMRDIPCFTEGMPIEVEVSEQGLEIRKLEASKQLALPFSEAELLEGMTPKTAHSDLIATPLPGEF
jgi:antitoxin MazE